MKNHVKRNYLEIKSIKELVEVKKPLETLFIEKVVPSNFKLNKFFYKEIGKKHSWIDRLSWSDNNWINYLNTKGVLTYILKNKEELVGFFEQNIYIEKNDCEIAYFGILEEYIGKKCGGYLLSDAIKRLFEEGISRVWLHTCSLDHENAIKNYLARGMKVFKSEKINVDFN